METTPPQPVSQVSPAPVADVPSDDKIFATIGYLAFLFIVPLIAKPKSKFCQHHAKQSILMFLITIVVLVVLAAIPLVGSLFTLGLFALYVLAIYRAFSGDSWNIPVIGALADKMDFDYFYSKAGISMSDVKHFKENLAAMTGKVDAGIKQMGSQERKPVQPVAPQTPPPAAEPPKQ